MTFSLGLEEIQDGAFQSCTSLTAISIPNNVTTIGRQAFYECSNLYSVDLPSNIQKIDEVVFYNCTDLSSITIPSKVTSIGSGAFQGCSQLEAISIPGNVKSIDSFAFEGCTNLSQLELSEGITNLGYEAFYGCISLYSVTIPSTINTWESYSFENCTSLNNISFTNGLKSIGNGAFQGCCSITSFSVPGSVTIIGDDAFSGCKTLQSVTIEEGLSEIGRGAFNNCISLSSFNIPESITSIGRGAFGGCQSLTTIVIPNGITIFKGESFANCTNLTDVKLPDNLTIIQLYDFYGCSALRNISIPESVATIGDFAFYGCSSLASVTVEWGTPVSISSNTFSNRNNAILHVPIGTISTYEAADYWKDFKEIVEMPFPSPSITFADANVKALCVANWDTNGDGELSEAEAAAVTDLGEVFKGNTAITSFDELQHFTGLASIGERAFSDCKNLTKVTIPESVSSIGLGAFYGCNLESLYIPANVESIGNYVFEGNKNLTSIQVDAANTHYDSRNQSNAIVETSTNTLIQGCKTTIIPSGIKIIGDFAFEFVDLTHIDLPQGLEKISWCAFYGCDNLDEVIFPDGLKHIGRFAYNGCTSLTDIIIPASVEYMGGSTFDGCYNIETLTVASGSETYISPAGSNAIISKDGSTLVAGCKNTIIPETVVTIGSESFMNQLHLSNVSLPATVTTIEDYAFCGCTNLTEIEIPKSVEAIGEYAFSGCSLMSVTVRNDVPVAITANVFTNYATSTLYVPYGSKAAYESADIWKEFKEIVEFVEVTDILQMENVVYIENTDAYVGYQVNLSVKMKNTVAIQTIQFDFYLPEGTTVVANEDNELMTASKARVKKFNYFNSTTQADGAIRLLAQATTTNVAAGDGEICTITLNIPDNMAEGEYPLVIKNIILVEQDNTSHSPNPNLVQSKLIVNSYIPGDANNDGEINAIDFNMIGNHILGYSQPGINVKAADINGDGDVNAIDFNMVGNIILNGNGAAARMAEADEVKDPA